MFKWLKAIIQRIKEAGAYRESDTERDGAFSYSGETHGFAVGIYYGFRDFRDWGGLPEGYAKDKNIEKGWYAKGGYVFGAVTRVAVYLAIGGAIAGML